MAFKLPLPVPKGLWRRTPPAVFPSVLGLFGLGLAWRRGAAEFGLPAELAEVLLGAIALLGAFALLAYAVKVLRRAAVAGEDLRTLPGRGGLAAGVLAVYLLSVTLDPYAHGLAEGILALGAVLHVALIALVLRLFAAGPPDQARVSPVWHLIFVGPIVATVALATLGFREIAGVVPLFTFPIAVVIWGISLWQFVREVPPAPLRPLLAMHLAPVALHGQAAVLLDQPVIAVSFAIAAALLMAALVFGARWLTVAGFSPFWGAFTFPLAATGGLWVGIGGVWRIPGGIALVAATLIVPWIALRILKMWASGALALKSNAATA